MAGPPGTTAPRVRTGPRVDFLRHDWDAIGRRAGYRCSFPDCGRLTVGPGVAEYQSEVTGKAAHIYSASEYGPRGQGLLSEAEIRSPANGIWMCAEHADLIDRNKGARYPVETLQSWKALHESRIAFEHSGRLATFGFVRTLTIHRSALFADDTVLELAKATLLIGANGSGKTGVCEWLDALATPAKLLRWDKKPTTPALDVTIRFAAPVDRNLRIVIPDDIPQLTLDGVDVPANPLPVAVTYLEHSDPWSKFEDDRQLLCQVLAIDAAQAHTLAALLDVDAIFLSAAEFRYEPDDDGAARHRLYVKIRREGAWRSFGALSGSEKGRTLLDLAATKARIAAGFTPSLLLVELKGLGLDWGSFRPYMERFSQSRTPFQTVITSWELTPQMEELGWQVYRIAGVKPDQRLEPQPPRPASAITPPA